MTPNYPPVVFKDQGTLTGLEPDFARGLGEELGWRIVFVELAWDTLIPALDAGQIDVIMSGNVSLVGLYWPLTEEYLAWAVRSTDEALYAALEEVLTRWKHTDRLQAFFNTWLMVRVQLK